jgi:hypothetical protein
MALALGSRATVKMITESSYGTIPGSGYVQLPIVRSTLGEVKPLMPSDLLTGRRDAAQPHLDVATTEGDVEVPVESLAFGYWLKALFGAPVTTGAGPYVHTFKSGAWALPSESIEIGHPAVPLFEMFKGSVADRLQLTHRRGGGPQKATVGLICKGRREDTTTEDASATEVNGTRFLTFHGSIQKDGSDLGNVVSCDMTYANNLDRGETIRDDDEIDGLYPADATATGNLVMRLADTTQRALAEAGDELALRLSWEVDASTKLTITFHEVRLGVAKAEIGGPKGVQVTHDWIACYNASAGCMVTAVLTNSQASYA